MTTAFDHREKTERERSESEGRHSEGGRTVAITNNTRRMRVFNLAHATYCEALGRCACTLLPGRAKRMVATSLTILAGKEVKNLADAVLAVPEIARAVKAGQLAVKRSRPRRAKQPSKPKSSQTTAKGSKRGKK